MTGDVGDVLKRILALTPDERYRLAAYLFDRGESALAHAIVARSVADETALDTFTLELT